MLFVGTTEIWFGMQSKTWPHTDGVIAKSTVEVRQSRGQRWHANIWYYYAVANETYTGTRIEFGMEELSMARAQSFVDRYPKGKAVDVFYSPSNPGRSVLEPGVFSGVWLVTSMGVVLVVGGVIHLLRWRRATR